MERAQIEGIVVEAVHEVFEALVYVLPEEDPAVTVSSPWLKGDLISCIHVSGQLRGVIAMVCSRKTARSLALNMLGREGGSLAVDAVADSAGEIINMVSGHIKTRFVDAGIDFRLSIPTVATARHLAMRFPEAIDATRVDFRVDDDKISFVFMTGEGSSA